MKQHIAIFALISLILVACSPAGKPNIDNNKMVEILFDIEIALTIHNTEGGIYANSEVKDAILAGVLEKHNVTNDELQQSLNWYADNIQSYMDINDSVNSRLKLQSLYFENIIAQLNAGNNEDVVIPKLFHLNVSNPTLSFYLDSVRLKDKIDLETFLVSFDIQGLSQDIGIKAGLYYTYKDTLISDIQWIKENTHYSFIKPTYPDSLLKSISGYVHMRKADMKTASNITLYNIKYQDTIPTTPTTSISIIAPEEVES